MFRAQLAEELERRKSSNGDSMNGDLPPAVKDALKFAGHARDVDDVISSRVEDAINEFGPIARDVHSAVFSTRLEYLRYEIQTALLNSSQAISGLKLTLLRAAQGTRLDDSFPHPLFCISPAEPKW